MAKIIDFKTREILADLSTVKTSTWKLNSYIANESDKVHILALDEEEAMMICLNMIEENKKKAA